MVVNKALVMALISYIKDVAWGFLFCMAVILLCVCEMFEPKKKHPGYCPGCGD